MKYLSFGLAALLPLSSPAAGQEMMAPSFQPPMPMAKPVPPKANRTDEYRTDAGPGRVTYVATHGTVGTTTPVKITDIVSLCGDKDGCTIRMGMANFDGTGRVASRDFLFFYNPANQAWRASAIVGIAPGYQLNNDPSGQDDNGTVEHVNQSWSCYFTDGEYSNQKGSDIQAGFGLLPWTQITADCWMTIIE